MTFDGATTDPMQCAVRDALIAFLAATAQAQAEATKAAQRAGDVPILQKQVASYLDFGRRIRVRVFRPTVPTTTIGPSSTWTIDFLRLVTPGEALRALHEFRALLALICGDLIDLWDVQLLHKKHAIGNLLCRSRRASRE
jgi:hypothetical protein